MKVLDTVLPALEVQATYPRWIKSTIKSTRNIQLHDLPHIPPLTFALLNPPAIFPCSDVQDLSFPRQMFKASLNSASNTSVNGWAVFRIRQRTIFKFS